MQDLTISDLAADFRAPTPSAAAEQLVVEKRALSNRLDEMKKRLLSGIRLNIRNQTENLDRLSKALQNPAKRLAEAWMRLDDVHSRLLRLMGLIVRDGRKRFDSETRALLLHSPMRTISSLRQRLDFHKHSLSRAVIRSLEGRRMGLFLLEERIKDLGPLSILKRGYSITRKLPDKTVLRDVAGVEKGDQVQVLLAEGGLECRIEKVMLRLIN
ncbi:MAG: exodeoxyribonuclease VII large subunit [Thermodesulfobacteriota bacterium]|nr:exodeoxyribonuclease VII large subunit [Thermodesulfobacteriota bacterium]